MDGYLFDDKECLVSFKKKPKNWRLSSAENSNIELHPYLRQGFNKNNSENNCLKYKQQKI